MIFKLALTFVCGLGVGVALMDTIYRPAPKPRPVVTQSLLASPIMKPDATVQYCTTVLKCGPERRYYLGMVRK